MMMIIIIIIDG